MAKKPAKFAKEKKQDVVGGKKMPWGFEAKPAKKASPKKAVPKMTKGANMIADSLMAGPAMGAPTMGGPGGMMGMPAPMPPMKAKKKMPMKKGAKKK